MSSQLPIWLTAEFVQAILRNAESDDSIKVINITSKPATTDGDNYMSNMLRTGVEYTRNNSGRRITEKKSLIMKIFPTGISYFKDAIKDAFETEIQMMGKTLIEMNDILNEKDFRLSPRIFYTNIGDPTLLVMEDLVDKLGFRMADRQSGLDLQHCILAMRGLAKFHASSIAICEKDPKTIDSYRKGIFQRGDPEILKKIIANGIKALADVATNWTELEPSYTEKLLKLSKVIYEKSAECARQKDDEFNVINHGDCWINNMLYRYNDEGKVIDHIFVDFQTSSWNSPAYDLSYFLSTSLLEEVELNHRDALLDEYLNVLSETMSRIGCIQKPPSMESLQKSLKEREFLTILSSCLSLPFVLIEKNEAISLEEIIIHGDGYVNPAYKKPAYRKIMVRRLLAWNSQGLLDS